MRKRLGPLGAFLVTACMAAITMYYGSPTQARADTLYSAGSWSAPICSCPVLVGGCVCAIGPGSGPAPVQN
jgi:hypothetical protein